jgi:hypothetical protein
MDFHLFGKNICLPKGKVTERAFDFQKLSTLHLLLLFFKTILKFTVVVI